MEPLFFLKGLIIGFTMAIPIGPIGVLCIRKTLAEGHSRGLIIGMGGATIDALYAAIAAFGLTFVSDAIAGQQFWFRLVGGAVLLFLGVRILRAQRHDPIFPFPNKSVLASYFSTIFLALTNPVTIFAFIAVFAALGLAHTRSIFSAGELVLGVFSGSFLWFLTLSYFSTYFRRKLDADGFRWINMIAGILILISGAVAFASLI